MRYKKTLDALFGYLLIFGVVACVLGFAYSWITAKDESKAPAPETAAEPIRIEAPVDTSEATETAQDEADREEAISLGEYKLTAYCACEKCCGAWGANRPLDKDGKPIVYTASMAEAKQGVTIAADTSIHPFGTVLVIGGNEYTVQDRGSAVKGKHVDIFLESHEEAKVFGVQYAEVFLKEVQNGVD